MREVVQVQRDCLQPCCVVVVGRLALVEVARKEVAVVWPSVVRAAQVMQRQAGVETGQGVRL